MALTDHDHERIAAEQAAATLSLHTRHENADRNAVCGWCVESWPCRAASDAASVRRELLR